MQGFRLRGSDNVAYHIADLMRSVEAGFRGFLVYDEGVLLLNRMRAEGVLPAETFFKFSVFGGYCSPAGAKVIAEMGADSLNPSSDVSLPILASMRRTVSIPLDVTSAWSTALEASSEPMRLRRSRESLPRATSSRAGHSRRRSPSLSVVRVVACRVRPRQGQARVDRDGDGRSPRSAVAELGASRSGLETADLSGPFGTSTGEATRDISPATRGDRGVRAEEVTLPALFAKVADGTPITWLTCYDYPTAHLQEQAGIDMILVGDSLGMTMLGFDSTLPVTMEDMIRHSAAVRRGAPTAWLVGDMPYMSYQPSVETAIRNAGRFMAEAGCDAVNLEGGAEMADRVAGIARAGIPVIGHLGLTPQSVSALGGFRLQGKGAAQAMKIVDDAQALEEAGAFCILLELVRIASAGSSPSERSTASS